jgi:hypothetical protein
VSALGLELQSLALGELSTEHEHGEPDGAHNNTGQDVRRYRRGDGTGGRVDGAGAWCATVVSWAYMAAAYGMRVEMPASTHRGAKALARRIAAAGSWVVAPGQVPESLVWLRDRIPTGAIICWNRTLDAGDWRGHVELYSSMPADGTTVNSWGGNRLNRVDSQGRPYAVVDLHRRSWREFTRRLYGIATL